MLAAAVLVNGLMNLALFVARGLMTVALVTVVFYTYPLLTAVGSAALGRERLTPLRIARTRGRRGSASSSSWGDQVGPDRPGERRRGSPWRSLDRSATPRT